LTLGSGGPGSGAAPSQGQRLTPHRLAAGVHRLAAVTAGVTLLLVVAGGLVTNTGAALAVPDWPTTFGHNMFAYPWSQMVGGVLYEHSHRLLGALVGLLTVGLAAALVWTDRRRGVRALALTAVVMVCVQGLLGGLRVLLLRDALAIVHGCLAQAFFAVVVTLLVVTSAGWRSRPAGGAEVSGAWPRAVAAVAALYGQIVLGAFVTHAGWIGFHLVGAAVATAATVALVGHLLTRPRVAPLAGLGALLAGLLGAQAALGLGAYLARFTDVAVPGSAVVALALPVAHRATASLMLGVAVALALHAGRLRTGALVPGSEGGLLPREAAA
jgi:cytochrome c oxidase assembly protein subunit 15